MGSGSNSGAVKLYCQCHENHGQRANLAYIYPGEGIEVKSRHHGTMHEGSLSVPDLLRRLAGTVDGSAVVEFVRQAIT